MIPVPLVVFPFSTAAVPDIVTPEEISTFAIPRSPVNVPSPLNFAVTTGVIKPERSDPKVKCKFFTLVIPRPFVVFPFNIAAVEINVTPDETFIIAEPIAPVNSPLDVK